MRYLRRIVSCLILVVFIVTITVSAESNRYGEPFKVRATVYTGGDTTKSGGQVREGVVAGKDEWLGCACVMYDENMNLIGIFEFKDTGGHIGIKTGQRIDIYRDGLESCQEWINTYGDYVYIQVVKGKG